MVIQQKHIDLVLVSVGTDIATAHISHDLAIKSDHAPALLSIHLHDGNTQPAVLRHKSATQQFTTGQLDNTATKSRFLEHVHTLLAACHQDPPMGHTQSVHNTMAKAATEILYPAHHRKEGEAVGITRWYTHKAIKVVNYVKHCLMQGDSVPITCNMMQLTEVPDWARCPLPDVGNRTQELCYLHAATVAKKKAHHHLDWK